MQMIDWALWIAAVPVWVAVSFVAGVYFFEGVLALAACVSWHRWAYLETRRIGSTWPWWSAIKGAPAMWWGLLGHRKGNQTWTTRLRAEWRGIGDWNLGTAMKVPE